MLELSQNKITRPSPQKSKSLASNTVSLNLLPVFKVTDIWDDNEVVSSGSDGEWGIKEGLITIPHHNFDKQLNKILSVDVRDLKEEAKHLQTNSS